jgi:alkylhydroperoxidase/carboxymuconolactone decarboxylase family protein YurZ
MEPGEKLLRLVLHDQAFIDSVLGVDVDNLDASGLDPRTHAAIRLGALLAMDAPSVSYQWNLDEALGAGVTAEEIVGCLIAVAPLIGIPRVIGAAPDLAYMIGYDINGALEALAEE